MYLLSCWSGYWWGVSSFSQNWNRPVVFESDPLWVVAVLGVILVAIATFLTLKALFGPDDEDKADIAIRYPTDDEITSHKKARGVKALLVATYWMIPLLTLVDFLLTMFVYKR